MDQEMNTQGDWIQYWDVPKDIVLVSLGGGGDSSELKSYRHDDESGPAARKA